MNQQNPGYPPARQPGPPAPPGYLNGHTRPVSAAQQPPGPPAPPAPPPQEAPAGGYASPQGYQPPPNPAYYAPDQYAVESRMAQFERGIAEAQARAQNAERALQAERAKAAGQDAYLHQMGQWQQQATQRMEEAVEAIKERDYQLQLRDYREKLLGRYGEEVIAEAVMGRTPEELDASAYASHQRYLQIKAKLGGGRPNVPQLPPSPAAPQYPQQPWNSPASAQQSAQPTHQPPGPPYQGYAWHWVAEAGQWFQHPLQAPPQQQGIPGPAAPRYTPPAAAAQGFPTAPNGYTPQQQGEGQMDLSGMTSEEAVRSGQFGQYRDQLHRAARTGGQPGNGPLPVGTTPRHMLQRNGPPAGYPQQQGQYRPQGAPSFPQMPQRPQPQNQPPQGWGGQVPPGYPPPQGQYPQQPQFQQPPQQQFQPNPPQGYAPPMPPPPQQPDASAAAAQAAVNRMHQGGTDPRVQQFYQGQGYNVQGAMQQARYQDPGQAQQAYVQRWAPTYEDQGQAQQEFQQ